MKNRESFVTVGDAAQRVLADVRRKMDARHRQRYQRTPKQIAEAKALAKRITSEREDK